MKIFADTADLEELKEVLSLGVADGCTTNPTIMMKAGNKDYMAQMKDILRMVPGDVSLEVTTNDTDEMVKQAKELAKLGKNVVVKIPMNLNGLKAVNILKQEGIKTNVTACMSTKQAVLAAKAGATYVSLFWARIEDMGYDAEELVTETADIFRLHKMDAQIIIGSFRQGSHINRAMRTGAHVLTIPTKILLHMAWNPRTDSTIDEFLENWKQFTGKEGL